MYESIKILRPYFHSLREVQDNVSLDIKLPISWRYEEIIKQYKSITTKVQDKNEKFHLISLISKATQNGYDVCFACADEIIKTNKELEEKEKLFQQKVKELQDLFKKESLDKLKELTLFEKDGQQDTTGIELVGEGEEKGRDGDSESQESDD